MLTPTLTNPNPPLIPEEKAAGAEVATEMTKADTSAKAKLRAAVKAMSRDEHGHMPHDPSCSVCVHARFRRAAAKKMEANHKVGGAAWGWVLGIDYFGPFDPDCDDNVCLGLMWCGNCAYGSWFLGIK